MTRIPCLAFAALALAAGLAQAKRVEVPPEKIAEWLPAEARETLAPGGDEPCRSEAMVRKHRGELDDLPTSSSGRVSEMAALQVKSFGFRSEHVEGEVYDTPTDPPISSSGRVGSMVTLQVNSFGFGSEHPDSDSFETPTESPEQSAERLPAEVRKDREPVEDGQCLLATADPEITSGSRSTCAVGPLEPGLKPNLRVYVKATALMVAFLGAAWGLARDALAGLSVTSGGIAQRPLAQNRAA